MLIMSALDLLFAVRCLFATFRRWLSSHVCFVSRAVRVRVAFQLRVSVAALLELTELTNPVEMPCLCCKTHCASLCWSRAAAHCASLCCFPDGVCVAFLLEFSELAKPVEMPCLCGNTLAALQPRQLAFLSA